MLPPKLLTVAQGRREPSAASPPQTAMISVSRLRSIDAPSCLAGKAGLAVRGSVRRRGELSPHSRAIATDPPVRGHRAAPDLSGVPIEVDCIAAAAAYDRAGRCHAQTSTTTPDEDSHHSADAPDHVGGAKEADDV